MSILARKLVRDVLRQRWQFLAVVLTIMLGVTLFAASFDSFRNLTRSYSETYDNLRFADLTVSGGDPDGFARTAAATTGVDATAVRSQADLPIVAGGDRKLYGRIVGMPVDQQPDVDRVKVTEGDYLSSERPYGVLVEQHMYDHFDLAPGDTLEVVLGPETVEVSVLGSAVSAEYLWPARSRQDLFATQDDFGVLFVPEAMVARATSQVAQTLVLYGDGADAAGLDEELGQAATDTGATDIQTQADQPSNAALNEDVKGFGEISFMFPLLFLTAAGMATFILLNRIVHSQRSQIGTLMANGLSERRIRIHYLAFGLVVGGGGALLGAVIGVVLGNLMTGAYTSALSIPDTITGFYPITPLLGVGFGLLMGAAAALAPARSACALSPAEAMRGSVPITRSGPSLLERLVPPLRRLPIRWRMSIRGIGRNPRRSLSTIVGVVLSLTLILVSWGMLDTTDILLGEQFDGIQHDDAQIFLAAAVDQSAVDEVAGVEGVEDAERVITTAATIRNSDEQYATQLQAFQQDTEMHTFETASGAVPLPKQGILAGASIESMLGVQRGDAVTIAFPSLDTAVETRIADFVDEPLGTYLYIDQTELESLLGAAEPAVSRSQLSSPTLASVMVRYQQEADDDAVESSLLDLPDVAAVISSRSIQNVVEQAMALFYVFVGIMLVFGATMAFALLFNMISVNISERSTELATLRSSGLSVREINHLMTGENLLLVLVGIPFGLAFGYATSALFLSSYSSDLFDFGLRMRTSTLVFAALSIVVTTLISQWPGLRALERLDIAGVVRERTP
jgi:putative ABC transport system permease protein